MAYSARTIAPTLANVLPASENSDRPSVTTTVSEAAANYAELRKSTILNRACLVS